MPVTQDHINTLARVNYEKRKLKRGIFYTQRSNFPDYFWSKVAKEDDCWLWKGKLDDKGYGKISKNNKELLTHRVSYELYHKTTLKSTEKVCHTCDNPPCCNPNHLFKGTQQDNMTDMRQKGKGNGSLRLTETDVMDIRNRYNNLKQTPTMIAAIYNIAPGYVWQLGTFKKWKHLKEVK